MMRVVRGKARVHLLIGLILVALLLIGLYHGMSDDMRSSVSFYQLSNGDSNGGRKVLIFDSQTQPNVERLGRCEAVPERSDFTIDTSKDYANLNFHPTYKIYWNQTFEDRYFERKNQWRKLPLKIFILLHSHNDPGWLKTFENYFYSSTVHILNNIVEHLSKHPELKFVWSEISFFAKWWNSLKMRPQVRDTVRDLVRSGRLEIACGAWVMTDEAGAHYHAMLDQMVEGHQWLRTTLGLVDVPQSGWSIDPFGHSSSWAYILRKAGIENTVIQRTHFAWKQLLADRQQLEFLWKQGFDPSTSDRELFTLMAPYDLYSIKHTCGPDTDVCRQFDFRRIAGEYTESRSVPITKENVDERARLILGQYGRTASLFPHNVALIPLGDDFRFNYDIEFQQQRKNYLELFNHINANSAEFNNTEITFGTLRDYFEEVHKRREQMANRTQLATITGDFMPYADIYADSKPSYWTGYYTTRPFWKCLARELQHYLRSAELLYTIATASARQRRDLTAIDRLAKDYAFLLSARQSLALFQHHDAITGTAKELVMEDYAKQLHRGIMECVEVISHCAEFVVLLDTQSATQSTQFDNVGQMRTYLVPDVQRSFWDELTRKSVVHVPSVGQRKIVLFNPKAHTVTEAITVHIDSPMIRLLNMRTGESVPIQLNPIFNGTVIEPNKFELAFTAELAPLSLTTFGIEKLETKDSLATHAVISVHLSDASPASHPTGDTRQIFTFANPTDKDFALVASSFVATFDRTTGLLKRIKHNHMSAPLQVNLMLQAYKSTEFQSGAYLFSYSPLDSVQNVTARFPVIKIVEGSLFTQLVVEYSKSIEIVYKVYRTGTILGSALEMQLRCDIRNRQDIIDWELVMRLFTDIKNRDKQHRIFYTDSNGFQMLRRRFVEQLGNEANYYPMTSAAYIEDDVARLTLLTGHSQGATSPKDGALEVMLERKIRYDDNRGLGEGIVDNKPFVAKYWLLVEPIVKNVHSSNAAAHEQELPNISRIGHRLLTMLQYPSITLVNDGTEERRITNQVSYLAKEFPCEVHLVNLRTLSHDHAYERPSHSGLLTIHHKGLSCRTIHDSNVVDFASCSQVNNKTENSNAFQLQFDNLNVTAVQGCSLTGMKADDNIIDTEPMDTTISVKPYELASFNVTI